MTNYNPRIRDAVETHIQDKSEIKSEQTRAQRRSWMRRFVEFAEERSATHICHLTKDLIEEYPRYITDRNAETKDLSLGTQKNHLEFTRAFLQSQVYLADGLLPDDLVSDQSGLCKMIDVLRDDYDPDNELCEHRAWRPPRKNSEITTMARGILSQEERDAKMSEMLAQI